MKRYRYRDLPTNAPHGTTLTVAFDDRDERFTAIRHRPDGYVGTGFTILWVPEDVAAAQTYTK